MSGLTREALAPVFEKVEEALANIKTIDSQLGVDNGKAAILNRVAEESAGKFSNPVQQVKDLVNEALGNERIGLLVLLRNLVSEHREELDAYVKENTTEEATQASVAEQTRLRDERKKYVEVVQATRQMLSMMAPELLSEVPEVKNLRGSVGGPGKTGPRLTGSWQFFVNGTKIDGTSLGDVKSVVNAKSVADLKNSIEASNPGWDWDKVKDPETRPSRFTFQHGDFSVEARTTEADADEDDNGANVPDADDSVFDDDEDDDI